MPTALSPSRSRHQVKQWWQALTNSLAARHPGKAGLSLAVMLLYILVWLRGAKKPTVRCLPTDKNTRILGLLSAILSKRYWPSWLTLNGHTNSMVSFLRRGPAIHKTRELVRTWDGGNFALDWRDRQTGEPDLLPTAPTLLVVHGLNGHSDEAYVVHAMNQAGKRGWRAVALNHRGCGGTTLSSGWGYNGAFTGDIRLAVNHVKHRYPQSPIFAAGYSLGANILVKYLGEEGSQGLAPVAGAVAVSNPWDFTNSPVGGTQGAFNLLANLVAKCYSVALTLGLKMYMHQHKDSRWLHRRKLDVAGAMRAGALREFDEAMTVPMWGYKDLQEYHADASSCRFLADVKCPLLCITAEDDPICHAELWPLQAASQNPHVLFLTTTHGGHIGWNRGINPFKHPSWADGVVISYLSALLELGGAKQSAPGSEPAPVAPAAKL